MRTHLSVRIVWHDRGWDGRICDHPSQNAYCVVQQHIRELFADPTKLVREDDAHGRPLLELQGWLPPCSRDTAAFSPIGYTIIHHDPLDFRRLPSTSEELPPYSVCPSPYRWMREENFRQICEDEDLKIRGPDDPKKHDGWVFEPDRQLALLTNFWQRLEKNHSLVFFYCNEGNPLDDKLGPSHLNHQCDCCDRLAREKSHIGRLVNMPNRQAGADVCASYRHWGFTRQQVRSFY